MWPTVGEAGLGRIERVGAGLAPAFFLSPCLRLKLSSQLFGFTCSALQGQAEGVGVAGQTLVSLSLS